MATDKEDERVRQLGQQYNNLMGPSRQLDAKNIATWLTSCGLQPIVSCHTVGVTCLYCVHHVLTA